MLCLFLGGGRILKNTGHRVVSAVAVVCAWADRSVVAETVEELAAQGHCVTWASGMRRRCC